MNTSNISQEPLKLKSEQAPGHHAWALRTIGQDLGDLLLDELEVELKDDEFVAQGRCTRSKSPVARSKPRIVIIKDFCMDLLSGDAATKGEEAQSETATLVRTYTRKDITRLDQVGARRSTGRVMVPDIRSLGESLRTIGRYVDSEEGRLVRLHKNYHRIAFEYVDRAGVTQKKELSGLDLHKLQQTFYQKRSNSESSDLWRGRN